MEHRISIVFKSQTYRNTAVFYRIMAVLLLMLKRPVLPHLRVVFLSDTAVYGPYYSTWARRNFPLVCSKLFYLVVDVLILVQEKDRKERT